MSAIGMDRPCSETHPEIMGEDNRRSMNHARKATNQATTIGIDIGKNNFHLIGLNVR